MVRNESRIIERAIKSLGCCERVLVVDTGSTDNTVEIAEKWGCSIRHHAWKDFGHNRSLSFKEAVELTPCCRSAEWALAMDADMKFVCDAPRLQQFLDRSTDAGHTIVQKNGNLEYRNVRICLLYTSPSPRDS